MMDQQGVGDEIRFGGPFSYRRGRLNQRAEKFAGVAHVACVQGTQDYTRGHTARYSNGVITGDLALEFIRSI